MPCGLYTEHIGVICFPAWHLERFFGPIVAFWNQIICQVGPAHSWNNLTQTLNVLLKTVAAQKSSNMGSYYQNSVVPGVALKVVC